MGTRTQHSRLLGAIILTFTLLPLAAQGDQADSTTPNPESSSSLHEAAFWPRVTDRATRGLTIGPIENALHEERGYGSSAFRATLDAADRLGANWISLTPFGRVWDLKPSGVELTFEAEFESNRTALTNAIAQAHAKGLKVFLVPHLWVETGGWRALIHHVDGPDKARFEASYRRFILGWAELAEEAGVDLFSVGVEWRSWVTTTAAPSFSALVAEVRQAYSGPLTYAANWDDAEDTVIWGELDVIGINAFYPLAEKNGSQLETLVSGGQSLSKKVAKLAARWQKPILFTEVGYTTRDDPAIRPWEWPDSMTEVSVNQEAQAQAYLALLSAFIDQPWFMGFFVWRTYADAFDTSQEAPWGFSPLHKQAELVLRDAYAHPFAYDAPASNDLQNSTRYGAARIGNY